MSQFTGAQRIRAFFQPVYTLWMWQARIAAKFLIGLSGIVVLGFGIKTLSPGYVILGLLIVFASVPVLSRRRH